MQKVKQFDEHFLARYFENSSSFVIVTSNQTGEPIEMVSPNINKVLGFESESLLNSPTLFDDLVHDDDIANYLVESQHGTFVIDSDEYVHSEYRLRQANDDYIWVKDTVQLIKVDGKVKQLIHILTDISDEVYLKESIHAQKDRLVSILHIAGFGLW